MGVKAYQSVWSVNHTGIAEHLSNTYSIKYLTLSSVYATSQFGGSGPRLSAILGLPLSSVAFPLAGTKIMLSAGRGSLGGFGVP